MGNISHSFTICSVSTKQRRKTSSSAHVFSFSLLTTPRRTPPLSTKKTQHLAGCAVSGPLIGLSQQRSCKDRGGTTPTIQDQACNSRGKDMCYEPAGEKEGAREKERRGQLLAEKVLEKRAPD